MRKLEKQEATREEMKDDLELMMKNVSLKSQLNTATVARKKLADKVATVTEEKETIETKLEKSYSKISQVKAKLSHREDQAKELVEELKQEKQEKRQLKNEEQLLKKEKELLMKDNKKKTKKINDLKEKCVDATKLVEMIKFRKEVEAVEGDMVEPMKELKKKVEERKQSFNENTSKYQTKKRAGPSGMVGQVEKQMEKQRMKDWPVVWSRWREARDER